MMTSKSDKILKKFVFYAGVALLAHRLFNFLFPFNELLSFVWVSFLLVIISAVDLMFDPHEFSGITKKPVLRKQEVRVFK